MKSKKEDSKFYPRLFFSLLFIGTAALGFFIIKPFLVSFLTGGVLAVLSHPVYKALLPRMKKPWKASLLVTIAVMLIILIPLLFIFNMLAKEAYGMYISLNGDALTLGSDFQKMICGNPDGRMCQLFSRALDMLPEQNPDYYLGAMLRRVVEFITENFSAMIFSLPSITLNFFVMLFVLYYALKDHRLIIAKVNSILPLRHLHRMNIIRKFKEVSFAVFYGHLFVALLQGVIAGVGYALLGIKSPFLWAALTALFALLPFIGTAFIWLPLAANFLLKWHIEGDAGFAIRGIILIVYGILAVGAIDNLVRPKIISHHADVHPVLVLLGVLGGLSMFGFVGLILGPVMLALLMILVEIYEEEKTEIKGYFG